MMNQGSPPANANAPAFDRGERKFDSGTSKPQSVTPFKSKDHEDRRNAAACFKNKDKREDWHADYAGVMVVAGLREGDKVWVNVHERTSRKGEQYLSVTLKLRRES